MIYLNMALGSSHGWGICGKNLGRELAKLGPLKVVSEPFNADEIGDQLEFRELQCHWLPISECEARRNGADAWVADGPLLQGIGDQRLLPRRPHIRGKRTVGYTFFEQNLLQPAWIENGRRCFDRVVAGSTWCARVLAEHGLGNVATIIQGVDRSVFFPWSPNDGPRQFLADRFVVFSGGKFELRKGQDVVIRAFKVLQDRHEDVLLLNAWFNPWLAVLETMRASPLIRFAPSRAPFPEMLNGVLADNGIDLDRVITCPRQLNLAMSRIYRNTDVGLFPNRCEGGTNLVLMEYMACGRPPIAVNTTGHADIVNHSNALVVGTQGELIARDYTGTPIAQWPEPDLDDVIDKLEWAYQNREKLEELGRNAAADLARLTWTNTASAFHQLLHSSA